MSLIEQSQELLTAPSSYEPLERYLGELSQGSPDEQWEARMALRALLRTDLYFLMRYGLDRADFEHLWLFARCREVEADPDGYLDLWAREHRKSSLITLGKTIQDILASHGDDPLPSWGGREITVGIFSHTRPAAKSFLRQIKYELESNTLLQNLFPDILYKHPHKESPKWSEDEGIIVRRRGNPKEATVEAWGLVDSQPTGKHFILRLYDDVVTEDSVTTSEQIAKTTSRWELSVNLGVEGGLERYVGTRYADADTYGEMIAREVVKVRIHAATEDGTALGRPVLFSPEELAKRRKVMGPYNFSCQMLLDPIPDDDAYYRREVIEANPWDELPPGLRFYMASDYATLEDAGDWTVHGVAGIDAQGVLYIVDWWRERARSNVWIDAGIDLVAKWEPMLWGEESGQIINSVEPELERKLRERQVEVVRKRYPSMKDMVLRNRASQAQMIDGRIRLPRTAPWKNDLVAELVRFPLGANDDQAQVIGMFGRMMPDMMAAGHLKNWSADRHTARW